MLLKSINNNFTPYHKDDEIARQHFIVQLEWCRNIAFDMHTCQINTKPMERMLRWLETFGDMGRMIVVFSMHCDKRLSEDGEFANLVRKL